MLIATWNVNSIRTRLSQIIDWINQVNPDILCLQETKVIDDSFPFEPFEKLGYSVEVYGQKSYNGVAIISPSYFFGSWISKLDGAILKSPIRQMKPPCFTCSSKKD